MTDEELDEARAREAYDLTDVSWWGSRKGTLGGLATAARLAREGWKPEDPLLKEARRLCGEWDQVERPDYVRGAQDHVSPMRLALAALRRGIEIGSAMT